MAFTQQEITALMVIDPVSARHRIVEALRASGMHMGEAAASLGCSYMTLQRWIAKLDLGAQVEVMKTKSVKEGWHHGRKGGRPLGATVANGAAPRGSKTKTTTASDRSDAKRTPTRKKRTASEGARVAHLPRRAR